MRRAPDGAAGREKTQRMRDVENRRISRRGADWIPELDGLRALMIFLVSAYHIWQQSWLTPSVGNYSLDFLMRSGYIWVDGTVLLSSFLLFLPYVRAAREGKPLPETKEFYYRRARRILPSYYFIILLVLFAVALPWRLYATPQYLVKDVATHLTFTFPWFMDTYLSTPLGPACWTLAIEVQAYLFFPFLARAALRRPGWTLGIMAAVGFAVRIWCLWSLGEFRMIVNQLVSFLDVYALGMLAAMIYPNLRERAEAEGPRGRRALGQAAATALFFAAFWGLLRMLQLQSFSSASYADSGFAGDVSGWLDNLTSDMLTASDNYVIIQRNQLVYRPFFGLYFMVLMLAAPFTFKPLRLLLGNPVTRFLSGVSMNYYLTHQTIIVHMRRLGFPASEFEYPNQSGDRAWQIRYVLWAFGLSFLAAVLITWLVEKPAARLIDRLREKRRKKGAAPESAA